MIPLQALIVQCIWNTTIASIDSNTTTVRYHELHALR